MKKVKNWKFDSLKTRWRTWNAVPLNLGLYDLCSHERLVLSLIVMIKSIHDTFIHYCNSIYTQKYATVTKHKMESTFFFILKTKDLKECCLQKSLNYFYSQETISCFSDQYLSVELISEPVEREYFKLLKYLVVNQLHNTRRWFLSCIPAESSCKLSSQ